MDGHDAEKEGRRRDEKRNSEDQSAESSVSHTRSNSRNASIGADGHKEKHRVRFTAGGESLDSENHRATFDLRDRDEEEPQALHLRPGNALGRTTARLSRHHSHLPNPIEVDRRLKEAMMKASSPNTQDSRPSNIRNDSNSSTFDDILIEDSQEDDDEAEEKNLASLNAQQKAIQLSRAVGTHSAPSSVKTSPELQPTQSSHILRTGLPVKIDDIPLAPLDKQGRSQGYYGDYDTDSDDEGIVMAPPGGNKKRPNDSFTHEAERLVRIRTQNNRASDRQSSPLASVPAGAPSGTVTPVAERGDDYVEAPAQYRPGILASLLKLQGNERRPHPHRRQSSFSSLVSLPGLWNGSRSNSAAASPRDSPPASGTVTPDPDAPGLTKREKWYKHGRPQSTGSLAALVPASAAALGGAGGRAVTWSGLTPPRRPPMHKSKSSGGIGQAINRLTRPRLNDETRITIHIADILSRQRYILKLCRALMAYGAPTHRLEEYLKMSARALEIESQFLYLPGCMIVAFDDSSTHTTEVKIVRFTHGIDLGRLKDVHEIYKEVVHDVIGVQEALERLEGVISRKQLLNPWIRVLIMGIASVFVAPFAFSGGWIDLPFAFILGCLVGCLQLIVAPKSELYTNVFEVSAAIITSFLARLIASKMMTKSPQPCFSAIAQSAIALILPGYTVLTASLELQSRSLIAGSVRLVYAIIYSFFLGYGITIGTTLYGFIDPIATTDVLCHAPLPKYLPFAFVPPFTVALIALNGSRLKQAPPMIIIAFLGYITTFFVSDRWPSNPEFANTLGALVIGLTGNLYARISHGVAVATLLPAVFVLVPSGLAASGSLITGLKAAEQIRNNDRMSPTDQLFNSYGNGTSSGLSYPPTNGAFGLAQSMVQVAIGITVGLFMSALLVYPLGKKRSGLFSF